MHAKVHETITTQDDSLERITGRDLETINLQQNFLFDKIYCL